ncbi:MAG: hypothetical protein WDN08_08480 [Rhizomicrobium sp.]
MRNRVAMIVTAGLLACAPVRADDTAPVAPVSETAPVDTPTAAPPAAAPDAAAPAPVMPPPVPAPPVVAQAAPPGEDAPAPLDDVAFDAAFLCPETLAGADSRIEELARYFAWAKLRHPDWNFRKRLDVRYGLLRRHACAITLAQMASSARPAFGR